MPRVCALGNVVVFRNLDSELDLRVVCTPGTLRCLVEEELNGFREMGSGGTLLRFRCEGGLSVENNDNCASG